MTKPTKRPPTLDEVFKKKEHVVSGNVTVSNDQDGYVLGTVFNTEDGGKTWVSRPPLFDTSADDGDIVYFNGRTYQSTTNENTNAPNTLTDWDDLGAWDANGILTQNAKETGRYAFLTTGEVRERHLKDYDSAMAQSLFKNKIRLK